MVGFLDRLASVDLLHVDDLGAENRTDWALEQLYSIVNTRYEDERSTVVTTNLMPGRARRAARRADRLPAGGDVRRSPAPLWRGPPSGAHATRALHLLGLTRESSPLHSYSGMPGIVIVGAQWGDEGKGKITDLLAEHGDAVVRFQGGNNAGHTIVRAAWSGSST